MSRAGPDKLLRGPQSLPRPSLCFPVWVPTNPQCSGIPSAIGLGESWDLVGNLHRAQLPYWRGNHWCKSRRGGLTDPVTGSMEECGIPGLHKNPTPGTGVGGKGLSGRHQPIPLVLYPRVLNSLRGPLTTHFSFF